MSTVSLREYLRQIDDLIERGHLDEAVAHCRYILQRFPKVLAVYRLLGKAYLEAQRYDEAADLFRRVLATVPDDLVAHVAMSAIAEAKDDLDLAIAHMEQAFEADPSNAAVQEELRRLYGARDGVEPTRIRLTRGALARMYYLGQLYPQAIAELRAALSEDPDRPSLQLLLAKVYAAAGKFNEAAQTCSTLLRKLPHCLEANRLMAELLTKAGRAEEARTYRTRAQALDPYLAYVGERWPTPDAVPDEQVTLEMLDWVPEMVTEETSLTAPLFAGTLTALDQEEEKVPDWARELVEEHISPERALPEEGSPGEPPADAEKGGAAAEIPDWMREAGWESREAPLEEPPAAEEAEEELAPAEIPDWLQELKPPEAEAEEAGSDEASVEPELPWLREEMPGASETVVTWLEEHTRDTPAEAETPAPEADEELPEWLRGLEEPGASEPQAAASAPEEREGEVVEAAASQVGEEMPDWLQDLAAEEAMVAGQGETGQTAPRPAEEPATPEWLQELGMVDEGPAEAETEEPSAAEALAEEVVEEAAPAEVEVPEWLRALSAEEGEPVAEAPVAQEEAPAAEGAAEGVPLDADEALAWLESLAAKQGAPEEELTTGAEERARAEVEVPEWLQGLGAEEGAVEVEAPMAQEEAPAEAAAEEAAPAEVEVPEWLRALSAEGGAAEAEAVEAGEAEPSAEGAPAEAEVPEWLRALSAEDGVTEVEAVESGAVQAPTEAASGEEAPAAAETGVPEWLAQPEEAPEVEASPEVVEAIPSWLMETEEAPQAEELVPETEGEAPPEGPPQEQGWLTPEAREALEREAQALESVPEWLAELAEEAPSSIEGEAEQTASEVEHLRGEWVPEETLRAEQAPQEEAAAVPEAPAPPQPEGAQPPAPEAVKPKEAPKAKDRYAAWLEQAREALRRGDLPEALATYQRLIKKGKHLEAIIEDIEETLYRFPVEVDLLQTLGDAYLRADRLQEALDMYTKAEELLR